MSILVSGQNTVKVSCIHSDEKLGTFWALGTDKEWIEIRTTKAGKIKVITQEKGTHPYFTVNKDDKIEKEDI